MGCFEKFFKIKLEKWSLVNRFVDFDGDFADDFDHSADVVGVDLVGVFRELVEHDFVVFDVGELQQDLKLLYLDVVGLIELAEKHLGLLLENQGTLL